jgi:hypothetical protein
MRPALNAHPEWGYLAPPPGLLRSLRIAVVGAAIGACAGAAAVVSLIDRPAADESVAARTMVQVVPAPPAPAVARAADPGAAESGAVTTTEHLGSAAILAELPQMSTDASAAAAPQGKANQKPRDSNGWRTAQRGSQIARGPLPLMPSARMRATIGANWSGDQRDAY